MITTNDLANELRRDINWIGMYALIREIGTSLNDRKGRFLKSDLFEKAIEKLSDGLLQHRDESGRDFWHTKHDVFVEMKYITDGLYDRHEVLRKFVRNLIVVNSLGTNNRVKLPEDYADFMMIVTNESVALVDKTTLNKYVVAFGDGLKCIDLPTDEISIICTPNDFHGIEKIDVPSYKLAIEMMQNSYLEQFHDLYGNRRLGEFKNNSLENFI